MSLANVNFDDLPPFGRKLMILAKEKNIGSPLLLAEKLYEEYRYLVEPAQRKNKFGDVVKDSKHDIEAIKRMVQNHFNEKDAHNVQSKYLLAYSQLFNCSLDYLYGMTEVRSRNLDIREICNKLNIDEKAVINLINGYDPDPEVFNATSFWSQVLSADIFESIPEAWMRYCSEALTYEDLSKKIGAIKKAELSAEDTILRELMEVRRIALEKMQPGKYSDREGAFRMLVDIITNYIDYKAEEWVSSRHTDIADNYYDNELKRVELLNAQLKDGAQPLKKKQS